MKHLFLFITKILDTNLIGILIGIVSGIAINIATGQQITEDLQTAIACMSIAVVCLIILSRLRSSYDDRVAKLQGDSKTPSQKWDIAVDIKNWSKTIFYIVIFAGFGISIYFGISRVIEGNKKTGSSQQAVGQSHN